MPEDTQTKEDCEVENKIFTSVVRYVGRKDIPSFIITIPKRFCNNNRINIGDEIKLEFIGFTKKGDKNGKRKK